jgi:hypothetical protein
MDCLLAYSCSGRIATVSRAVGYVGKKRGNGMKAKWLVVVFVCLASQASAGDKKHVTLRVIEPSQQQVNNHPWSYTTPGSSNTTCQDSGTVNATATDVGSGVTTVNGTTSGMTNCNSTYHPPQTHSGNRVTVTNSVWVEDVGSHDRFELQCTANWIGSRCGGLNGIGFYSAEIDGNNMKVEGVRGMDKKVTIKFHILTHVPGGLVTHSRPLEMGHDGPAAIALNKVQPTATTPVNGLDKDANGCVHTYGGVVCPDKVAKPN